jgi:hypothetical protein
LDKQPNENAFSTSVKNTFFSNSSFRKVRRVCDLYLDLPTKYRHWVLQHLAENHNVDVEQIRSKAKDILEKVDSENSNYVQQFEDMRTALNPPYTWLFTRIGQLEGGVKFLVDMRSSTIELSRTLDPNAAKSRLAIRFAYFFEILKYKMICNNCSTVLYYIQI